MVRRRQAHARPARQGDGLPAARQPRLRQRRDRDVPGEQGGNQLLPHRARPRAAAAAAGRVRRRRDGLLHREERDDQRRHQGHPRRFGRGDGAPAERPAPVRQGRAGEVPAQ